MKEELSGSFNPQKAYQIINETITEWIGNFIAQLPNFLVALLIVLISRWLARLSQKLILKSFNRITDNPSLTKLVGSLTYIVVFSVGTFAALSVLHLDKALTSLLAGAGVLGLALGIAFQDIASNFLAGTFMTFNKPFVAGDLIESNGYYGVVEIIHLRTTEIKTVQGQLIKIPNAQVFRNPIINFTALGKRRVDIPVGVHYNTDLQLAKKIAIQAVEGIDGRLEGVKHFYEAFGDSSINFIIVFWIPFTNVQAEYLGKRAEAVIAIKKAFDEHNITIPFPIRTLELGNVNFTEVLRQVSNTKENKKG